MGFSCEQTEAGADGEETAASEQRRQTLLSLGPVDESCGHPSFHRDPEAPGGPGRLSHCATTCAGAWARLLAGIPPPAQMDEGDGGGRGGANRTVVLDFVLLGVTDVRELQLVLFVVLLLTYALTLLGNLLIVALTAADRRLATPMYYFLCHFSLLEVGFTSAVTPQMLAHLLTGRRTLSRARCFAQLALYFILGTAESLLLAVMSVDRYLAICRPLRYPALMTARTLRGLVLACWAGSLLFLTGPLAWVFSLPFCGPNVLDHFFCDSTPLLELVCADTTLLQLVAFMVAVCTLASAVLVTSLSYGRILATVLHLPAAGGRRKAFSTCSSHILVVSLSYGSCLVMYLTPKQTGRLTLNKGLAFFNTTVSPLLNPFIYCLRNELVQKVSRDLLTKESHMETGVSTDLGQLLDQEETKAKGGLGILCFRCPPTADPNCQVLT
ncbi:Olfactory receptor 49 [Galemys pyrenaicus]|uniref:Olfactory receptor 49 n=1 Tax=Galemys pyrenaicus TaxID=202257 RepID=A0A8J6ANR3_GALPY|nr:Olfactory receptor 49 [Galemys pyrenaicus]